MDPKWFRDHVAYTIAKFGMSMCTLGMSAEFARDGIAVNSLWPLTTIDTVAIRNLLGGEAVAAMSRSADIMADAAHAILVRPSRETTGNFFIDEEVLRAEGISDFSNIRRANGALRRRLLSARRGICPQSTKVETRRTLMGPGPGRRTDGPLSARRTGQGTHRSSGDRNPPVQWRVAIGLTWRWPPASREA